MSIYPITTKLEMSVKEHNKALDVATEMMIEAIINDEVESKIKDIKTLFWGADTLTDIDIQDIKEMAIMLIDERGL